MHVVQVATNWKAASVEGDSFTLGQRVLLSGPNGSGKSRIIEALELALTGAVSNYAGRASVKDPKMLWRSAPQGAKALFIEVTMSDGRLIRWVQTRSNGKATVTVDGVESSTALAPGLMQIATLREQLFGAPAKAEQWLASVLGVEASAVVDKAVLKLPSAEVDLLRRDFEHHPEIEDLLTHCKTAGRNASAEAKAASGVVEELEHVAGPIVTDDEIAKADKNVKQWDAVSYAFARAQAETQAHSAAQAGLADVAQKLATFPTSGVEASTVLAIRDVVQALRACGRVWPSNSLCPCCRTEVGAEHLTDRLEKLQAWMIEAQGSVDLVREREALEAEKAQLETRVAAGVPPIPMYDAHAHAKAREHYDDLCRRRVAAQAPGMAQTTAIAANERGAHYKAILKALQSALADAVTAATEHLEEEIASYFPDSMGTPCIQLRPQVALGVERGGKLGVPSGGEEAALLLALAQALQGGGILVLEDRAFDANTLQQVIAKITDRDTIQVMVQTTTGVVAPEGWVCLDFWPPATAEDTEQLDGILQDMVQSYGA